MNLAAVRRKLWAVPRRFHEARMFAEAMRSAHHPIRRLRCGYLG